MPAEKFFTCLDLDPICLFLDGHYLQLFMLMFLSVREARRYSVNPCRSVVKHQIINIVYMHDSCYGTPEKRYALLSTPMFQGVHP